MSADIEVIKNELKHVSKSVDNLSQTIIELATKAQERELEFERNQSRLLNTISDHTRLIEYNQKKTEDMQRDIVLGKEEIHDINKRIYGYERLMRGIVLSIKIFWVGIGGSAATLLARFFL